MVEVILANTAFRKGDLVMHRRFLAFEKAISISPAKKKLGVQKIWVLENKINNYLASKKNIPLHKFQLQGSFKMNTLVCKENGEYDIDYGLFFIEKPLLSPLTIKNYIYRALKDHTGNGTVNREKCISIRYAGAFKVDIPIYYQSKNDEFPFFATKSGWKATNPQGLIDWFDKKTKGNPQVSRLIKYFKYWTKLDKRKTPKGIALTIWMVNNYMPHERDDISFYKSLKRIEKSLLKSFVCINPVHPYDNLTGELSKSQRKYFKKRLKGLVKYARVSTKEKSTFTASFNWSKELGDSFLQSRKMSSSLFYSTD